MSRFQSPGGRAALLSILIAVTTLMNLIMIPMPPPLAEYDLSPILTYAIGILVTPINAAVIIAIAQGLGTAYKAAIYGWPAVFIPGAMIVRGLEALLISILARLRPSARTISRWEVASMIIGVLWETLGFFIADWILFGPGMAMITLMTIVDAIFIPPAIAVVAAVRRSLDVERLL